MPRLPSHSRPLGIGLGVLAIVALAAPIARGGVDLWAEVGVLLAAGGASLLCASRFQRVPVAALALAAVVGWMLVQLTPVPPLLHAASPGAVSIFRLTLAELGSYPRIRPLALDLANGHRELGKASACLLLFLSAATFADAPRRRAILLRTLGGSSIAVACVVLAAVLLGVTPALPPAFPFVNANHLSGFLLLTGFVALGQAVRATGRSRVLWAVGFAIVATVILLSLSRSGIAVLLGGLLVYSAWTARLRLLGARARTLLIGSAAIGLTGGAVLALPSVLEQFAALRPTASAFKLDLWPRGLELIRDFPWTGIGRGAFPTVFQAYRRDVAPVTFTHLENEWLQALIDLGIPCGLLLLGSLLALWTRRARAERHSPVELGLLVGMLCLGLQNAFDFSLEILGVAAPFSIALGLLAADVRRVRVPRPLLLGTIGLVLAAGIGSQALFWRDERRLAALATVPVERIVASGIDVTARRPADYLPQVQVAARLIEGGRCTEALGWLRRGMLLAPQVPEAHAFAGRCLALAGDGAEARREYGLAVLLGSPFALSEAAQFWSSLDDLYAIAGDTPDSLLRLAEALAAERPADAQQVLSRVHDDYGDPRATMPLARVAMRNRDHPTALELARERIRSVPEDVEAYAIAASALDAMGSRAEATAEIERGLASVPGSSELLSILAAWAVQEHRFWDARNLAMRIRFRTQRDLSNQHVVLAKVLAAQGRQREALGEAETAVAYEPENAGILLFLADLQEREGLTADAVATLERAAALPGSSATALAPRLERLRALQGTPPQPTTEAPDFEP